MRYRAGGDHITPGLPFFYTNIAPDSKGFGFFMFLKKLYNKHFPIISHFS